MNFRIYLSSLHHKRRSIRQFEDCEILGEVLEQILDAELKEPEQIKAFLKIPDGWYLSTLVILGYPSKDAALPAQVKAAVENKVHWNKKLCPQGFEKMKSPRLQTFLSPGLSYKKYSGICRKRTGCQSRKLWPPILPSYAVPPILPKPLFPKTSRQDILHSGQKSSPSLPCTWQTPSKGS